MNGNSYYRAQDKAIALGVLLAVLVGAAVAFGAVMAQAHAATCHSAYYEYAHVVPRHTVKATSKHSAYTIGAHSISGHWIYANCK